MSRVLSGGLAGRLVRVFLLQAAALSVAVVVGVFAAAQVVENVLVEEALNGEAEHYWERFDREPGYPRPDTENLLGYLAHPEYGDDIPDWLAPLEAGFRRVERPSDERNPLVHVSDHGEGRLYLVFDELQVSRLVFFFGVAPLSLVLLLIYALTFIGYRLSRSAISPVVQLAARVDAFDARNDDLSALELDLDARRRDDEVAVLSEALEHFVERIGDFIKRERNFTRNASHELRTPLAVMRANLDGLSRRAGDDERLQVPIERMRRTLADMEKLLETLLLLAREDESRLPREAVILNDLLAERIELMSRALPEDAQQPRIEADCLLQVQAPQKVLSIVFDNLIRNAVTYSEGGDVVVHIGDRVVCVIDDGPGIPDSVREKLFQPFQRGAEGESGYGLGLSIVKRMCDRFGWPIDCETLEGEGTEFCVSFPEGEVVGRRRA